MNPCAAGVLAVANVQPMAVALGGEENREYSVKSSASVHFIAIYSVPGTRL